jgi:hypothetical protein
MTKTQFTGMIKIKGWMVKDALDYWGRGQEWYHMNCNGDDKAQTRLKCMIDGLPDKTK